MSIEGQGHFFTIYFPGFVRFVLYWAKISGERLQDHWSSGSFSPNFFLSPFSQLLLRPGPPNFVYILWVAKYIV